MLAVQKHLRDGNTVESLAETHGIRVYRHPSLPLVGLKYHQLDSPKYDPIVRECRGLVLEDRTWNVVAKPFNRFYNAGEDVDNYRQFDWTNFDCTTKEDGSLCIVYCYKGEWHVSTSGSFGLGCAGLYGGSWRQLFWETARFDADMLYPELTYIFELCTPHNKVVRVYPKPSLYLLGAYDGQRGELSAARLDLEAAVIGCERPERHQFNSMDEITAFLEAKAKSDMTFEGVVIRDRHNVRFKVKSKSYVALHRLHDNGNIFNPKRLIPLVLAGERDEVVAYFPEVAPAVDQVAAEVDAAWRELVGVWRTSWRIESQREFAEHVLRRTPFSGLLFTLRKQYGENQTEELLAALWRSSEDVLIKHLCRKEAAA